MKNPGKCQIDRAVHALEQAIEERKAQMQHASTQSTASPMVAHLFSEILNRAGGFYGQVAQVLEKGGEFAREFLKKTQQGVEEKPWEALRKVAVYSFGIGLFLSLRHRKSSTGG